MDEFDYTLALEYTYRGLDNQKLFYRYRYNNPEAPKPKTYATWYASDEGPGRPGGWRRSQLDETLLPRLPNGKWPLYGLPALAQNPRADVWWVEGEKVVDYVNNVLRPTNVVAVSTCVYGAIHHPENFEAYDLEPLRGRKVLVWPDNDENGWTAARVVCACGDELGIATFLLVDVPTSLPRTWDLADIEEHPVDWEAMCATAAPYKGIVEMFSRSHPDQSKLPKTGHVTQDRRTIVHWDPQRPEIGIDNSLPYLSSDQRLFSMSGRVVRVGRRSLAGAHRLGDKNVPAPSQLLVYEPNNVVVREEVNRSIEFGKVGQARSGDYVWTPQNTPNDVATSLIGRKGEGLTQLEGVVDYPALAPDGSILKGYGYNQDTRLFIATPKLAIKTGNDPAAAYKAIVDNALPDVLFADEESKAMAVCAMLTMLVKRTHGITTPGFLVTATSQQTGKTELCNIISTIVLGVKAPAKAWADSADERRKNILSVGMQNPALVVFDNIPDYALVDCPHLSATITMETFEDRLLGKNENQLIVCSFVLFLNGNNLSKSTDMHSRLGVIALDAQSENPMDRKFVHKDACAFAMDNRAELLGHLFTILQSKTDQQGTHSRFNEWAHMVRDKVLAASGIDCWKIENADGVQSEELRAIGAFLNLLEDKQRTTARIAGYTAQELLDDTELRETLYELRDALGVSRAKELAPRTVGILLRKIKGRVVGDRRLGVEEERYTRFLVLDPKKKPVDFGM
ncbi:MAG: hypothetical protein ABJ263_13085 [Tateyamaria sp.]|uniref:hypothetical protein n=2 Tax=Tateyamaria sp. TaxID=1929288 RepID=UPI0032781069